ncbi:uncharacterized protein BKA55DRAFT_577072, partial [Fusarium redolens]
MHLLIMILQHHVKACGRSGSWLPSTQHIHHHHSDDGCRLSESQPQNDDHRDDTRAIQ